MPFLLQSKTVFVADREKSTFFCLRVDFYPLLGEELLCTDKSSCTVLVESAITVVTMKIKNI